MVPKFPFTRQLYTGNGWQGVGGKYHRVDILPNRRVVIRSSLLKPVVSHPILPNRDSYVSRNFTIRLIGQVRAPYTLTIINTDYKFD